MSDFFRQLISLKKTWKMLCVTDEQRTLENKNFFVPDQNE